ncbi:terminase small subunit [Chitinasiproducens palmae]|uniref:Phage DNA packaging protein, Nu1 subunit of terminase n=1 Tax=Chitinasiproducens palmae TaxID=1770053 RepID=A0A1H2PPJ6_9BURK|nr:terminase small subunit [Chitinasiproducens palmae]SDV48696.1 Phage DNA packaging protein, Nu1 subunit of terminase [Chitinasiproducens palmae]
MGQEAIETKTPITQAQFGAMVGISQPAVSDLIMRGILTRDGTAHEWLLCYCGHLREQAAGRYSEGELDLAQERAALAREQRIRIEMANAVQRRELAPIALLEATCARIGRRVSAILEAIPPQVKRRLPHLPASDVEAIEAEISRARNVAAAMKLDEALDGPGDDTEDGDTESGDEGA